MTCGSLNTSEQSRWQTVEESLLASLRCQPLLIVIRPERSDLEGEDSESPLLQQIADLHRCGLRHLEIAWADHPGWIDFVVRVRAVCPGVHLGAASVTTAAALDGVAASGLHFAMSPCLDAGLLQAARSSGMLLVPGVFSPTEMLQAVGFGCHLVKLFPACNVGPDYLRRLKDPLGTLPEVIAAGGLDVADLQPWLSAGHAAVALGRRVVGPSGVDPALRRWLVDVRPECYR